MWRWWCQSFTDMVAEQAEPSVTMVTITSGPMPGTLWGPDTTQILFNWRVQLNLAPNQGEKLRWSLYGPDCVRLSLLCAKKNPDYSRFELRCLTELCGLFGLPRLLHSLCPWHESVCSCFYTHRSAFSESAGAEELGLVALPAGESLPCGGFCRGHEFTLLARTPVCMCCTCLTRVKIFSWT